MIGTDNETQDTASSAAALALAWMETEAQARLICTTGLALVWANRAARAAFADGGELDLKDGAIATRDRAHQAEFCAFVKACGDGLSTLALPARDGDGHLLLRGRAIAADGAGGRRVGLTFLHSGGAFRALYADIDRAFQLTPAEHRILLRLIEGLSAEGIAAALDLSVETVRSHIRHIYNKMGVASREAMFAKVRPFRL